MSRDPTVSRDTFVCGSSQITSRGLHLATRPAIERTEPPLFVGTRTALCSPPSVVTYLRVWPMGHGPASATRIKIIPGNFHMRGPCFLPPPASGIVFVDFSLLYDCGAVFGRRVFIFFISYFLFFSIGLPFYLLIYIFL